MIVHTKSFATSTGDDEELAYVYCVDKSGYCLSLARFLHDELVEVMVVDQRNHKTRDVTVKLSRRQLRVNLSAAAAAALDGITEYMVPLEVTENEFRDLDAALSVIFEGGSRGCYNRRFCWYPCDYCIRKRACKVSAKPHSSLRMFPQLLIILLQILHQLRQPIHQSPQWPWFMRGHRIGRHKRQHHG